MKKMLIAGLLLLFIFVMAGRVAVAHCTHIHAGTVQCGKSREIWLNNSTEPVTLTFTVKNNCSSLLSSVDAFFEDKDNKTETFTTSPGVTTSRTWTFNRKGRIVINGKGPASDDGCKYTIEVHRP
ncbi:MAG: hypothetical protein HOI47_19965 [Candidatus Scalindua sp.]|nr:hypothetical protein [Candidatus Scalindua sp.]